MRPEQITLIYKPRKGMTQGSNIMVRGIGPMSAKLRSGFQLVSGRMFKPGLFEAIVARRIAERFQGMGPGDKFRVQTTDFEVVGIFEAGGKAFESESWVDINALSNATKRDDSTSVLLRVTDASSMDSLAKRISDDQRLHLKAMPEIKFYEDQQGMASAVEGTGGLLLYHGDRRARRYEHDVCGCGQAYERTDAASWG